VVVENVTEMVAVVVEDITGVVAVVLEGITDGERGWWWAVPR
jgi:hypothetical protein